MGLSFEAELRKAEATINALIAACKRNDGAVYIGNRDKTGFCAELAEPICITYFYEQKPKRDWDIKEC